MKSGSAVYKFLGIAFTSIGIVGVILGFVFLYNSLSFVKNSTKAQAEVIEKRQNHTVISYSVSGTDYVKDLSYNQSSLRVGSSLGVYVSNDNPDVVKVDGPLLYLGVILSFSIGGMFLIVGISIWAIGSAFEKKKKAILENGIKVTGVVEKFQLNRSITKGTKHPVSLILTVKNPVTLKEQQVISEPLFLEGHDTIGASVDVYFEPENGRKYYVDADKLFAE